MLFSSQEFLFGFLPIVLAGFWLLAGRGHRRSAGVFLSVASLCFYGWWNPRYVPLFLASMAFNYLLGGYLRHHRSRAILVLGIAANLLLLGYYKYAGFFVGSIDQAFGLDWTIPQIVLPLAISFFTFQQIAYLSDAYDGAVAEHDFLNYALFISFFPHLIAGPITHHQEMLSQFSNKDTFRPRLDNLSIGTTLFLLGLFKKVVFADTLGVSAGSVFHAAAQGTALPLLDAWGGALAYTLQIYFDFSGYTDMAIGLGLMFGIGLPPNFDSPYKARNVIEFWSRWHMTLTRFLTAYIYNPVVMQVTRRRAAAGKPLPRRGRTTIGAFLSLTAFPTVLTMFLSGLWHGAGWQFILFGLLHGFYLVAAHGWRAIKVRRGWKVESDNVLANAAAVLLTFLCVVVAMVFFRAADVPAALNLLAGMAGLRGVLVDPALQHIPGVVQLTQILHLQMAQGDFFRIGLGVQIALLMLFVWTMPNTQQWMQHYRTALGWRPRQSWVDRILPAFSWRPRPTFGLLVGLIGLFAMARVFSAAPTEFLYFQF